MVNQNKDTVGVVVPMCNAERTIAATLESISRQSHAELDIVVVDDGSTDGSAAIVAAHARRDQRVRLLAQSNSGVAAARNAGAAAVQGDLLAFIDADDLWAPTKIEYQLAALDRSSDNTGLVYCWFASIDQADRVVSFGPQAQEEGDVMESLFSANWIGNGSSILVRREAFDAAGGYDLTLRARGAEGAEDILLCMRVSEQFEFRVVPRYLVGYRMRPGSMSTDALMLYRSTELVIEEYLRRYPGYAERLLRHEREARHFYAYRAAAARRVGDASTLVIESLRAHPILASFHFAKVALSIARGRIERRLDRRPPLPLYTETIW